MPPVYPGEILLEEFLNPLSVSQYRLAKGIGVPGTAPTAALAPAGYAPSPLSDEDRATR